MKILPCVFIIASLVSSGEALSQQNSAPARPATAAAQLTPEQQAQIARQDAEMGKAAAQVIQLVDQNKIGEVWDGASGVAKSRVSRDSFIQQIASDRQKLGAVASRKQIAITRAAFDAKSEVPAGNYINAIFATKFANSPNEVRELVSFRLDDDKIWRVSGYSLR